MNLVWVSDIHLNFLNPDKIRKFANNLCDDDGNYPDHVVITGDVSDGKKLLSDLITLEVACRRYSPGMKISFVLGNHDFYGTSVADIRSDIRSEELHHNLWSTYLTAHGPVELSPSTCLIGTDGWCDGALGDIYGPLIMNDWYQIKDYHGASRVRDGMEEIARRSADLARREVENLRTMAAASVDCYENIIIATHIPPWKEATWHEDATSNDTYLPWFSSYVMGVFLNQLALDHPNHDFTVLCGHTHTGGVYRPLDNLTCYTAQADYGYPGVAGRLLVADSVNMFEHDNPYRNGVVK